MKLYIHIHYNHKRNYILALYMLFYLILLLVSTSVYTYRYINIMKTCYIKASDIAACIGYNKYKNVNDLLDEYCNKFRLLFGKPKENSKRDDILEVINEKLPELSAVIQKTVKDVDFHKLDNDEISEMVESAREKISSNEDLTEIQKEEVFDELKSKIYRSYGEVSEEKTSKQIIKETSKKLVKDKKFYKLEIYRTDNVKFIIYGQTDRIEYNEDGSKVLIEIKNRMNRLFKFVPKYELVQIQIYLRLIGLENAKLVEQYKDTIYTHIIKIDNTMIDNVISKLEIFCKHIYDKCIISLLQDT